MIAGEREERLNVLAELVKWARIEREARERREHSVAREASRRMREVIGLLGFDPLEYQVGRDAASLLITRRCRRMLDAMPASTTDLAKAAGVPSRDVHAYLSGMVAKGDVVVHRKGRRTTWWEVAE